MMEEVAGNFAALIKVLVLTSPPDSLLHLVVTMLRPETDLQCYSSMVSNI